jgi:hypothetical protein
MIVGDPSLERRRRADSLLGELLDLPPTSRVSRLRELRSTEPGVAALVERLISTLDEPITALDDVAASAREVVTASGQLGSTSPVALRARAHVDPARAATGLTR